ncbi:protease HtpX [Ignatzschineria rhizosphaerae]|uniref:Protease HtpX n=1 Tax=Ignatzschineria rhizosphaerae TaxID=2923279 RepID=A0ABY3X4X9_9GAMM|nr:protease HtpX [Ignatzschineria rhizosphaerae]UNM95850.1 protease HtpX [Ignatzschineria rhizosphaerae]
MLKRFAFFTLTNIAVIAVVTIIMGILQALGIVPAGGTSTYAGLFIFCLVWGMGGSIFSLLISKWAAKRSMGVYIIEEPQNEFETWYVGVVTRQAETLGIKTPEIGIFEDPSPNAFATGATKNSSLVAINTGLINSMNKDELEAVIGHEMAHVANGDMVTMMLLQGVINAFVMFFARVLARVIASQVRSEVAGLVYFATTFVLQILFGILASLITSAFSRYREYRADEGGARLTSSAQMAAALEALKRGPEAADLEGEFAAFGISGKFGHLFSTHPPLEKRIEALQTVKS